jgi:hypothetical protein
MLLGLNGDSWKVLYSKNCPPTCGNSAVDGQPAWYFGVSNDREPHYILRSVPDSARNAIKDANSRLTVVMSVDEGELKSVQDNGTNCYATVMMQRAGDDMTGQGQFAHYRQWAGKHRFSLVDGKFFTMSIPMDRLQWTGVWGQNAPVDAWTGTLNNLEKIGVTLGGTSDFGHGIKGTGRIYMTKFEII